MGSQLIDATYIKWSSYKSRDRLLAIILGVYLPLLAFGLLLLHEIIFEGNNEFGYKLAAFFCFVIPAICTPAFIWEVRISTTEIFAHNFLLGKSTLDIKDIQKVEFNVPRWWEKYPGMNLHLANKEIHRFQFLDIVPETLALFRMLDIPIELNTRKSKKWKRKLNKFKLLDLDRSTQK